jgi:hypothetical protein
VAFSNVAARRLYARLGFIETGKRRAYCDEQTARRLIRQELIRQDHHRDVAHGPKNAASSGRGGPHPAAAGGRSARGEHRVSVLFQALCQAADSGVGGAAATRRRQAKAVLFERLPTVKTPGSRASHGTPEFPVPQVWREI